jgi:hypothetical protein
MKPKMLFVLPIAATLMAGAIAPQVALAAIPMVVTIDEGLWSLDVPNADTTASAYGGRLRLYDVHIAKMVEVTHDRCGRNGSGSKTYYWSYSADRGRANMGSFKITCELAQSLASTYELGKPESTTVRFEAHFDRKTGPIMDSRTEMIPILNITGGKKIDKWMNFTSNFQPWHRKEG